MEDYCRLYLKVLEFLHNEAQLLDSRQFIKWTSLFTEDSRYVIYAVVAVKKGSDPQKVILSSDTKATLLMKMRRLMEEYSWSENPYSKTVRMISNVTIDSIKDDHIKVSSILLLIKNRVNTTDYIVAKRNDILMFEKEGIKIRYREVELIEYPQPYKNINLPL